jgi:mannose-6-phosphate isomerase-like protein (cupin superfamily)
MHDAKMSFGDNKELWYRERCFIRELVNTPEIPDFSLAETRVEPGVRTELHKLDVNEWYVIRSGCGKMELDGGPWFDVTAGDVVSIPANISQRIENTGANDLIFECVCLPRFTTAGYVALE